MICVAVTIPPAGLPTSFSVQYGRKFHKEKKGTERFLELTVGLCVCVSWVVASGQDNIRSTGVLFSCGAALPTDVSAGARLHSVMSPLSCSQGLGPGLWATAWGISLEGSVSQYHRDQGWAHHQEWLCHRVWTDRTPLVPFWGCRHLSRPFLLPPRNSVQLFGILTAQ